MVVHSFGRLLSGSSAHRWPFSGLFFVGSFLGELFLFERYTKTIFLCFNTSF